jgi:hypothetical protein
LAERVTLTGPNNWTAIGPKTSSPFTGSFDGQGYTIANLRSDNATSDFQGMFSVMGGTVINLGLSNVNITGNTSTGGLAGYNRGIIQNCYITGTVKGTETHVGGLVGENYGLVQKCYSTANVEAIGYTGGIAGYNANTVQACYTTGNVNSIVIGYAGGVAGMNDGFIQSCYATGYVSGGRVYADRGISSSYAGGVAGCNIGTIRNTVALNTAVCTEWSSIGRISGESWGEMTCNYARSSMVVYSYSKGGNKEINPGLDTEDGVNITNAQWNTSSWWTNAANWYTANNNLAWDTSVWDIANNRLPRLREMPARSQNPVVQ